MIPLAKADGENSIKKIMFGKTLALEVYSFGANISYTPLYNSGLCNLSYLTP